VRQTRGQDFLGNSRSICYVVTNGPLEVRVDLTDCDYKSDSRLRPVTMVQAGGSEFVVVELGAWEGVQFGVFEVRSTSLVERIATWALDF
jgi:hypothetical protein